MKRFLVSPVFRCLWCLYSNPVQYTSTWSTKKQTGEICSIFSCKYNKILSLKMFFHFLDQLNIVLLLRRSVCVIVQPAHSGTVCSLLSGTAVFHYEPSNSRRSLLQYSRHVVRVCTDHMTRRGSSRNRLYPARAFLYYNALYIQYKYKLPKWKHLRPCREHTTTALYWRRGRTAETSLCFNKDKTCSAIDTSVVSMCALLLS